MIWLEGDFLGQAAEKKQLGKQAMREKRFDDAWRLFHEQKAFYLKHAARSGFDPLSTRVIDASIHDDLANILRMESRHKEALTNIAYTYKAFLMAKRPINTLEKKLMAYYGRAYDKNNYEKFRKLLIQLGASDYISIRSFVEVYFPQVHQEVG